MTLETCQSHNKDGSPCSADVQAGTKYCVWHDPERAEDREAWRRMGGRNSSNRARARKAASAFKDLSIAQTTMVRVIQKLEDNKIDPAIATAMATCVRALDAVTKSTALAELQQEVAATNANVARIEAALRERPA